MNLIFATNNSHKLSEIRAVSPKGIRILGLKEAGFEGEIPEDHETLEENASQKAWYIFNALKKNCFADDTGLEVDALGGEPGVFSARFSKTGDLQFPDMDVTEGNIKKLLFLLKDENNRNARFRTVISLILDGKEWQFEGVIKGRISHERSGKSGFGYDPVFIPEGETLSFADMDADRKNEISHRAKAMARLVEFLKAL
ncbi:MAG: RdgB/HAM1 family non-canonical purine NTP pyrophosphatase [Bacteroidales bacterium]|nr:RdgB/HAM1 family non-canonical purine NTP pyrophosphatase [Bacteroidales bacterium]MCB8998727.1 RdgB/HAM1 family non-canonical purine NTP pyrophosphatase [Bacteroidales bacterium]